MSGCGNEKFLGSAPRIGTERNPSRSITNRNRRRAVVAATAVLSLAAFDRVVRHAQPALDLYDVADHARKPGALAQREMSDIVLMGSSRANYALVPEEFTSLTGLSAYNLGVSGSKVTEWQILSRDLFEARPPRLVVLGVNASEFRADYLPVLAARRSFTTLDLLESLSIEGPSLEVIGEGVRRNLAPFWAAFERRYEIRMWGQERLADFLPKHAQQARELRDRVARPIPADGYEHPWAMGRQLRSVEERLLTDPATVEAASIPLYSPDAPGFTRLSRLLDWLIARRIPVMVVYLPNSPRTEARWAHVEPRIIDAISGVCRTHDIAFIPCSTAEIPRTNRDYIEEIHVGLDLARRISRRAAQEAVALGLVAPRGETVVLRQSAADEGDAGR